MKQNPSKSKKKKTGGAYKWALQVFIMTMLLSGSMSLASDTIMSGASLWVALAVLAVLIGLGVLFDMLGVAITSSNEAPFVAMASKKVRGAKQSLRILKNAEKYSNICNDVIGDICGVVSGAAGAAIAALLTVQFGGLSATIWAVISSAMVSALTVSLKALGKGVAMKNSRQLVRAFGVVLSIFSFEKHQK